MARYGFEGTDPDVHEDAHVSEEATLVGDVSVAADASVWPGAVLRGDVAPVAVGAESHVGDGAILHAATLGDRVMVGHGAVVNDATIEDGALVGFNATVAGGRVGARSVVAAGTVVPEEFEIPPIVVRARCARARDSAGRDDRRCDGGVRSLLLGSPHRPRRTPRGVV